MNIKRNLLISLIVLLSSSFEVWACNKIVLTGGPGAGKSSIIEKLKAMKFEVRPEAFTQLCQDAESQKNPNLLPYGHGARGKLVKKQKEFETCKPKGNPIFFDRGMFDILTFGEIFPDPAFKDEDKVAVAKTEYDMVFFIEPLPKEYYKNSDVRLETYEASLETHKKLLADYENYLSKQGKDPKEVLFKIPAPKFQSKAGAPTSEEIDNAINLRTQAILDKIEEKCGGRGDLEYVNAMNHFTNAHTGAQSDSSIRPFVANIDLMEKKGQRTDGTPFTQSFFGVHQSNQEKANLSEFRKKLTERLLGTTDSGDLLQVVGSSKEFSPEGTAFVKQFLHPRLEAASLIEYGYTGHKTKNAQGQDQFDVNTFVSDYVDSDPGRAKKVIANILGHTHDAFSAWNAPGSRNIQNFVAVYNDYTIFQDPKYEKGKKVAGYTTFGDDIHMSDEIMEAKMGDRLVCLEGGAQSFRQAVNVLKKDIPVDLVYNLRVQKDKKLFSAAEFLRRVQDSYKPGMEMTPKKIKDIYKKYFFQLSEMHFNEKDEKAHDGLNPYQKEFQQKLKEAHLSGVFVTPQMENEIKTKIIQGINPLWDINRGDAKTKQALFDSAIDDFIEKGVYKKVQNLCTFYKSSASKKVKNSMDLEEKATKPIRSKL